jgi:hypothetical protein
LFFPCEVLNWEVEFIVLRHLPIDVREVASAQEFLSGFLLQLITTGATNQVVS